jgi:hypothetical protein
MTRISSAEAIATLDHNLTELLDIHPPEEPAAEVLFDNGARRRRIGLLIALPISLLLAVITAGVLGPDGWLPAIPTSKPLVRAANGVAEPGPGAARTSAEIASRQDVAPILSQPAGPAKWGSEELIPAHLGRHRGSDGSRSIVHRNEDHSRAPSRLASVERGSARPTRLADAEPRRPSRASMANDEVASRNSPDDPDGRLAAIDAIRMLRLR